MNTRDEDKALLSEPVTLPGENDGSRGRSFKRKRSFSIPFKKIGIKLAVVLAVALVAFGGFKLYQSIKNKPAGSPNQQQSAGAVNNETNQQDGKDVPAAELSESYVGQRVRVEFKHPKTWKVHETEDGGVRIESAEFTYPTKQGEESGNFRIYIRTGARSIDGKYIGHGVAIKPSEKLTYSAPAVGQRSDTLLSTFGIDTQDNFAFFLIAGNFQLKPGDSLGPNYGKEPETYIIVGGYSGPDLKDDLATNSVSVDYYSSTNAYGQGVEIVKSLKLK
jgi:hypothetical protein